MSIKRRPPPRVPYTPEKFMRKICKTEGCWMWLGSHDPEGYGRFSHRWLGHRKAVRAHRFVYEMLVGPIPEGLQIDHLCRNTGCVNPAHLEPVTAGENQRRGINPIWTAHVTDTCKHGHSLLDAYERPGGRSCRQCVYIRKRRDVWSWAT